MAGNRWVDLVLLRHGCEFALGMLLWRRFRGRADGLDVAGMVLFLGASLVQILRTGEVLAWSTRSNDGDPYAAPLLFLIALAGLLFALRLHRTGRDRAWSGTTVRTLGLMTYPLYLVHQAAGGYLMSFLHHHGVPRFAALAIVLAGVLVLSAVVATALEPRLRRPLRALLERVPWRRAPAFAGVRPARGGG